MSYIILTKEVNLPQHGASTCSPAQTTGLREACTQGGYQIQQKLNLVSLN